MPTTNDGGTILIILILVLAITAVITWAISGKLWQKRHKDLEDSELNVTAEETNKGDDSLVDTVAIYAFETSEIQIRCPYCDAEIKGLAKFCEVCGRDLLKKEDEK